jgi:hypothetical protein
MDFEKCPFAVGSVVVYRPSVKGRGVPEGFETAIGGGLYWTEFPIDLIQRSPLAPGQSLSPFRRVCYGRGLGGSQPVESLKTLEVCNVRSF